jgi:hypothetical protein
MIAKSLGRPEAADLVGELLTMSLHALPHLYIQATQEFAHTMRRDRRTPTGLRIEGTNLRYAAISTLGIAQLADADQRELLAGNTAQDLVTVLASRGVAAPDLGGAALVGWATAEVGGVAPQDLFTRLLDAVRERATPRPTVDFAWTITALLAARHLGDVSDALEQAVERLLTSQGAAGIFPHALPRVSLGRYRAHVGCYADQVYPIQALSRYYAATGSAEALNAANRCADRICELQGSAGQWWWHYDVRTGNVVEKYPVYSVHQHAMGPMALIDLHEAGGTDHISSIAAGLSWLNTHPETTRPLRHHDSGAIWRKVGRHEPLKASRAIHSASTALSPRLQLRAVNQILPPGFVDYECRPYELGWLLYAWLSNNDRQQPAPTAAFDHVGEGSHGS